MVSFLSVLALPVLVHLVQLVMYVLALQQYGSVLHANLECSFLLSCHVLRDSLHMEMHRKIILGQ